MMSPKWGSHQKSIRSFIIFLSKILTFSDKTYSMNRFVFLGKMLNTSSNLFFTLLLYSIIDYLFSLSFSSLYFEVYKSFSSSISVSLASIYFSISGNSLILLNPK